MRIFNYTNLKNHRWDSEILGLVAQIHEFKGKQELYLKQKPAALEKLIESKHEIIRIYESSIIFDTIAPNQGGIAYE